MQLHELADVQVISVSDEGIVQLGLPGGDIGLVTIPLEKVPSYRRLCRFDAFLASRMATSVDCAVAPTGSPDET